MIFLDYIYNKVYAPVEDDFGFDDAGDMDELDDELQMEEGNAASGEGGDELYEHWKVQVDANQDPVRIDKYLADKMAYQSRNRIQQAADAGFIHVNGKPVKSNYKVRPNDLVTLMLDRPRHETSIKPEEIAINVVYEDDQLMVVNKEAGMVVYLPEGIWYDFHTGEKYEGGKYYLVDAPLDTCPVFAKAGSMIPTYEVQQYTDEKPYDRLNVLVFPGEGEYTHYQDNGTDFAYRDGAYNLYHFVNHDGKVEMDMVHEGYERRYEEITYTEI